MAAAAGPRGTNYLMSDHQGSPRVVTTTNGSVASRHDYLPFGEELSGGVGLRNSNQGYATAKPGPGLRFVRFSIVAVPNCSMKSAARSWVSTFSRALQLILSNPKSHKSQA